VINLAKIRVVALLPMKGHSERVPNKNIKSFVGNPLYHAVIQALQKSEYVQKIVINTDSNIIAYNIQKHFPEAQIISRPEKIQGDSVPMNEIIAHDLSQLEGEHFLQTHSTNPLLTSVTLDRAIESYFRKLDKYDSLFSVTRLQTRLYWQGCKPVNHDPTELLRTQDLPPIFEENSNFYIFSRESFYRAGKNRIGLRPQMFQVDKLEAIDIDEPQDFELAEILYKTRLDLHES
jgi:CMP-N-acetylneuraminic acid synthetase